MGMIYNFLPFMVLPLFNVLTKIDENVLNAARDLGANSVQVFFKVTLPLSLPGIISGITMVFVPSLTIICHLRSSWCEKDYVNRKHYRAGIFHS